MKIIAVIVSFNRLELLQKCIASILSGTKVPDEIIVCDNASTDGTPDWLRTQSNLTPLLNTSNNGGAFAFAQGMKHAYEHGADWIWTMDDDVLIDKNCLEALTNCAIQNPDSYLIPFIYGDDGNPNANNAPELDSGGNVTTATFVGTFQSKKCIETVGYPYPNLFRYFDDVEYYYRLSKKGIFGSECTAAKIYHASIGKEHHAYMLESKTSSNAQLYLRNYYFYMRQKIGNFSTFLTVLHDVTRLKNKLKSTNDVTNFSRTDIAKAGWNAFTFKPEVWK